MRVTSYLVLLLAFVAGPSFADTVYRKKGAPITGIEVISVTYRGIKCKRGMATLEYKWSQIDKVEYENQPFDYIKAKDAHSAGKWEEAIEGYRKAVRRGKGVWVEQTCLWNIADIYANNLGNAAEAGKALRELLEKVPETRYKPRALILLGRISLSEGKMDEAGNTFNELVKLGDDPEVEKEYKYLGMVWLARVWLMQGKTTEAKRQFERVRSSAGQSLKRIFLMATVGEASCLVKEKSWASARDRFNEAIEQAPNSEQELLAEAYNGLGETFYYQQDPEMDQALRAFLKVVVLFPAPGEMPKALWHAAKCFHQLKGSNKEWAARSAQLRNQLRDQYPNSSWAKKW